MQSGKAVVLYNYLYRGQISTSMLRINHKRPRKFLNCDMFHTRICNAQSRNTFSSKYEKLKITEWTACEEHAHRLQ